MDIEATYAAALLECGWPENFRPQGPPLDPCVIRSTPEPITTTDYMFTVAMWWEKTVADEAFPFATPRLKRPRLVTDPVQMDNKEFTEWWVGYKFWLLEARDGNKASTLAEECG